VEERRPATPAPDAGPRPDDLGGSPPDRVPQGGVPQGGVPQSGVPEGGPPQGGLPQRGLPPDAEQRPIGALLVVGFLTLTILVTWYGMFALNLVRN
jgi:hypothetical protein